MSRPRSRSPHYRRFPWEEPDFDPYRVLSELDGNPMERSHHPRDDPEEHYFRDYFREDIYREGQRRSPYFPDDHQFRNQHPPDQEEFYHRRPSPHRDVVGYDDRRLSPLHDAGGDGERRRGGLRELFQSFENRGRSPYSPLMLDRERSLLTSQSHTEHQQREPGMGWRREEQDRGRGPSARLDDKRGGTGREREGRRNTQGLNRDRRREEPHEERNPPLKRQRRELDDINHLGYRNEGNFGDQRYSFDTARDVHGGDRQGSLPHVETPNVGPVIIEHDHGITDSRVLLQFEDRRGLDHFFDHQQSPHLIGSSQERFRTSDRRLDDWEEKRRYHIQDNLRDANYLETRRSPVQQDRQNPMRHGDRDDPTNQKGRSCPRPARGRLNHGQGGRTGLHRNQPRLEQGTLGYQDPPREEQNVGYRTLRKDCYEDPIEQDLDWAEKQRLQQWEHGRSRSLDPHPPRKDLDPKMPRQRERGWSNQKTNNMTVVTEETLTVKVDMSRPVNQNSSLCYSSDRQLSLDLVNVGRQRLDFLPMLEHSGTYRETAMHTGTFAQEIITLVHQVKEQYFRDDGITLNDRFSAPQKGGYSEEETEELTLDQRFTSNRGFSLNTDSLLDDEVPLFSRLGPIQGLNELPVRDPADLRHNLERRRQERLEGVKVTIQGNSMSMHSMDPAGELEYSDKDDLAQMEDGGFSSLSQEQSRRREGNMGQRRAAPSRTNSGPQRRNNRGGNRGGQMRRQNNRNNPTGPHW